MTTDLEADLRREFDAAGMPAGLTFHAESVLRQGSRTIRRHRIVAAASAALTVALLATGASLLTSPHDTAAPPPASHKATAGIVQAHMDGSSGITSFQVEFNRDARVRSGVRFSAIGLDGKHHDLGAPSTGKPGQAPDSTWRSGFLDGHPYTIGVVPGTSLAITFAGSASYVIESTDVPGTGYTIFSVAYKNGNDKEAARPALIATISWSGPTGVVDGIEGDHRLSGQILRFDSAASEKLIFRSGRDGRTTVSGEASLTTSGGGYSTPQSVATTDASGVAVVSGRYPVERRVFTDATHKRKGWYVGYDGGPIAAGILPPGASNIGAILTTGAPASTVVVPQRLPDGRVIFAIKAESAHPSQPSKDSIKAVTWTNADGTQGRKDVTQQQR